MLPHLATIYLLVAILSCHGSGHSVPSLPASNPHPSASSDQPLTSSAPLSKLSHTPATSPIPASPTPTSPKNLPQRLLQLLTHPTQLLQSASSLISTPPYPHAFPQAIPQTNHPPSDHPGSRSRTLLLKRGSRRALPERGLPNRALPKRTLNKRALPGRARSRASSQKEGPFVMLLRASGLAARNASELMSRGLLRRSGAGPRPLRSAHAHRQGFVDIFEVNSI